MIKTNENKISIRYNRPALANYQLDALFNDSRYGIVEASTKAGKTAACLVWIIEQALQGKSGQDFWWCCPVYGQAKMPFAVSKPDFQENHITRTNPI
jgi:hypothetical protein